MSGIKSILIITSAVLGLLLIWTQLTPPKTQHPDSSDILQPGQLIPAQTDNALLARIESLEAELASEQSIRQQHENRLSQFEQQLSTIPMVNLSEPISEHDKASKASQPARTKLPTLQDKLLAANIPLDTIQRIQQHVGQNRLARLQLRNQAIREDWIDSPEYIEKVQQLPGPTGGLREEFGDQVYDQYLYDSGRPNRIIVQEVFCRISSRNCRY